MWEFACQHELAFFLLLVGETVVGGAALVAAWYVALVIVQLRMEDRIEERASQERIEKMHLDRRKDHFEQELDRIFALADEKQPDGDGWSAAFRRVKEALTTHDALQKALRDELCKTNAKLLDFKSTCDENTRLRQQIQDLGDLRADRDRLRASGGIAPPAFPTIRHGPQCPAVYPEGSRSGGFTCCVLDKGHSGCHQNGPHWIDGPPARATCGTCGGIGQDDKAQSCAACGGYGTIKMCSSQWNPCDGTNTLYSCNIWAGHPGRHSGHDQHGRYTQWPPS